MQLIAMRTFRYAGRNLEPGDEFEAERESHALAMIAGRRARRAVDAPEPVRRRRRTYRRRDMVAQDPD